MAKGSPAHGIDAAVYVGKLYTAADRCQVTSVSVTESAAVSEASGMGCSWEQYVVGLRSARASVEALLHDSTTGGIWGMHKSTLGTQLQLGYYPLGKTAGYPGIELYPFLVSQDETANLTSAVMHSLEFQQDEEVDHTYILYHGTATATGTTNCTGVQNIAGGMSHETDGNVDTTIDLASGTGTVANVKLGMKFHTDRGGPVNRVRLWLKRVGTPAGTLNVTLYSDSSGLPGSAITNGTSATVSAGTAGLGTAYAWIDFTYTTDPILQENTNYHIVLEATGYTYGDGATEVCWGVDQSTPHTTSYFTTYNNSAWSAYGSNSTAAYQVHLTGEKCFGIIRLWSLSGTGTPTVDAKVQDAPDNSTWADVITFTQLTATGVERSETANEPTDEDLRAVLILGATVTSAKMMIAAGERDYSN